MPLLWCDVTGVVCAADTACAQLPPTTMATMTWATAVDHHHRRWCVSPSRGAPLARTEPPNAWNSLGWFQLVAALVQRVRDCGGLIVLACPCRRAAVSQEVQMPPGASARWLLAVPQI